MVWTYTLARRVKYTRSSFRGISVQSQGLYKGAILGINVTTDEQGNYYLDQKKSIESAVKAAKVSGAKVQKLPYPLDGPSLSKADNEVEANEVAKTPYRAIVGMLSYIMGHTKPDIALNVLSRYCNNPGRRHVEFLLCLVKYCKYSKDDRLKFHAHPGPYDAKTMRSLTQARFQCDADYKCAYRIPWTPQRGKLHQ